MFQGGQEAGEEAGQQVQAGKRVGVADQAVEIYRGAAAGDGEEVFAGAYGDAAGRLLPYGGTVADDGFAGAEEMGC